MNILQFYCIGALATCCYLLLGIFWQDFLSPRKSKNPEFYRGTNFDKSFVDRELTNRDVFLHKAFYDLRDPAGPRIRLLVTATCDGISGAYSISIFGKEIGVEWKMCTENAKFTCPEPGQGCQYWHYDIGSKVYRGEIPEKITVTHDGVSTEVKLHVAPSEYTDSLSACIGPLHWFNDWPRLIAFIELWRRQGTHKFLVSVQSVSKSVQQVIDYYVDKGIIETHNWPILPFSPMYDPNFKTFYVSDNLEFQHCIFWSKSKYTFLGDVDDFIYIRNRSYNYFDYLEKWLAEKSDFGALKFSHVGLTFRPRIVENPFIYENFLTFDSFRNPITFDNWRFPKTIFLTKAVKANWVHYPNEYFLGKTAYEAPKEEALHLHGRYDFDLREDINESSKLYPDVQFFEPNKIDNTLKEIGAIVREIFHGETPEYRGALAHDAVERCRNTGWSAQSGCLEPGVSCFDDLFPLDHWVLAEPNEDGHYVII